MTKAEKKHLERVSQLGCIVCANLGFQNTPAEIHHIRHGVGMGQRNSHKNAIPLCHLHHRTGGHGVAFHAGPKEFGMRYGDELELLAQVKGLLKVAA